MKTYRETVKEILDKQGPEVSEQDRTMLEEVLTQILEEDVLPSDALGFPKEFMESLYAFAYRQYMTGRYTQAATMFYFMVRLDPTDSRFALGLGASYHMLKDYRRAIEGYMYCAYLQPDLPVPFYHMCDCYLQLGNIWCAIFSLRAVIKRSGDNPLYEKIKERSRLMLNTLEEQMAAKENEKDAKQEAQTN